MTGMIKMLKGVNRQIIEVSDTGNAYYERAILFVRPQYRDAQQALLEKQAKKLLCTMQAPSAVRKRTLYAYNAVRLLLPAIAGALITAVLFGLFY